MTRKRKAVRPCTGRSAIQNLQYLGFQVNHPLLINEVEAKEPRRRNGSAVPVSDDIQRFICFTGVPACVLHAKGSGQTACLAEESAAHAMLDFFRVAISPLFVTQLCSCADEKSMEPLVKAVREVFIQLDTAIASDFLGIKRCTQLELTSVATIRGREVKKQVINNLRDPRIGYHAKPSSSQPQTPQTQVMIVPTGSGKSNVEVVTLDDEEDEQPPLIDVNEGDGDVMVTKEKIIVKKDTIKVKKEKPDRVITPKRPSSAVESMRKEDQVQVEFYTKSRDKALEERRREEPIDSAAYFGEPNTSLQGPSDVFCSVPNTNAHQYVEAVSSDENDDDEDSSEGEKACPSKRAKMGADGDEVVVLNTTSSIAESPSKRSKMSDAEEIGDIVDEWHDDDDDITEITPKNQIPADSTEEPTPSSSSASCGSDPHDGFYAGHTNHRDMIEAIGQPVNYQARILGVVVNEELVRDVEQFVEEASERSTDSVKRMSQQAWDHYQYNCQSDSVLEKKLKARTVLLQEVQKLFPDKCVSLQITGSTINGCGSFNSDVDMCLCYPTNGYRGSVFDDFQCERSQSSKVLRKLDKAIKRCKPGQPFRRYINRCELIPAKVPIVKLTLQGEFPGMEVDINVNNIAGIYNSHLTHYYSLIDGRFPTLALAIKHWASRRYVNNAQQGYLNSYTIILLVVHFLQCGVTPAVLPNLQYLFPEKFDKKLPLSALQLYGDIAERLPVSCPNTWSTAELFMGFFYYYNAFDFAKNAISIRSAQVVPRSSLPAQTSNYPIFVEEPFDAINTARSVRTAGHLAFIKKEFRKAKIVFQQKNFSMRDVGVIVADVPGRQPWRS